MINKITLVEPRGFCAGVSRAIEIVEKALQRFPNQKIYVKHEIVHNKVVVQDLKSKGVVFIEDLEDVPDDAILIFSAHGVSSAIEDEAKIRNLTVVDASCPLVKKVHREVSKYEEGGYQIILVGHRNHPELEGTAGRVRHRVIIVENVNDALSIQPEDPSKLALATQTTLSIDDTKEIVDTLTKRFPNLAVKNDICYATQNRQDAVKKLVEQKIDLLLVIGSQNSSNSNRLRDISQNSGIASYLINTYHEIQPAWLNNVEHVGITAGASAPEFLVQEVIEFFRVKNPNLDVKTLVNTTEDTVFFIPKILR